jgi:hypothetical protein
VPVQRRTVHKHRNLLAHAPERQHEEITADYNDMIYAATREEIEARRKGSSMVRSPTACRKRATGSSRSRVCRQVSGEARERRTRLSVYTKSSSGGSRRRLCCRWPTMQRCFLGFACLRPDQHAQGRWLANARHQGIDQPIDLAA